MEALTALQWAKEGYVPNADAVGEERWTNCFHGQKATYYKDNEVHKDSETAKDMLRAKRKEHKKASDKRDEKRKKNMAYRENMKTEWQWLQEGKDTESECTVGIWRDSEQYIQRVQLRQQILLLSY